MPIRDRSPSDCLQATRCDRRRRPARPLTSVRRRSRQGGVTHFLSYTLVLIILSGARCGNVFYLTNRKPAFRALNSESRTRNPCPDAILWVVDGVDAVRAREI